MKSFIRKKVKAKIETQVLRIKLETSPVSQMPRTTQPLKQTRFYNGRKKSAPNFFGSKYFRSTGPDPLNVRSSGPEYKIFLMIVFFK